MTSEAGLEGKRLLAPYAMVKAQQRALVGVLAREWGPAGVRVNAVGPARRVAGDGDGRSAPTRRWRTGHGTDPARAARRRDGRHRRSRSGSCSATTPDSSRVRRSWSTAGARPSSDPATPSAQIEWSRPPSSRSSALSTIAVRSPVPPMAPHRSIVDAHRGAHRTRDHERSEVAFRGRRPCALRVPRRSSARGRPSSRGSGPAGVGLFSISCTLHSMRSRCSSRSPATSRIAAAHRGERSLGGGPALQRLPEELEALRVVREECVLLRVEVAEERPGRDVRRGGDLLDGDVLEAAFGGKPERGGGDLLAGAELVALTQPERSRSSESRRWRVPACGTACHESGSGWRSVTRGTDAFLA